MHYTPGIKFLELISESHWYGVVRKLISQKEGGGGSGEHTCLVRLQCYQPAHEKLHPGRGVAGISNPRGGWGQALVSNIFLEEGMSEDKRYRKKKNILFRWHEQRTCMGPIDIGELWLSLLRGLSNWIEKRPGK